MSQFFRSTGFAALIALSTLMIGCAGPAPNYAPSIENVEAFKKSGGEAAKLSPITMNADLKGGTSLSLRANTMVSPVGANYADYISAALRQELELAKMFNPQSGTEISGVLLRNNIDAGGFSTNAGQIEVRFIVKRAGQVRFDKVKSIEHKWDSSFVGAVAIPLAVNNYPIMVQKLIASLVSDAEFVQATRN
jgi:hypothetical protein